MPVGSDTQSTTASDTFGGLDVTLDVTLPTWTDDTLPVDVDITTSGIGPSINVAIVVDTSGSTGANSGSDVDGNAANGTETYLEAEQFAAKELFQSLLDAGYDPDSVTITLVEYNSGASLVGGGSFALSDQAAFESAVDSMTSGGGTNFESGLDEVLDAWNGANADADPDNDVSSDDTNLVVFLSDGSRNQGDDGSDELGELETLFNAQVTAIGVGSGSNLSHLNVIDNTGGAERVVDAGDLADIITTPPPLPELLEVEIFVDGVSYGVFIPGDGVLTQTALGYTISCHEITGWPYTPGETIEVEVFARFDDGSSVLSGGGVIIPVTVCFGEGTDIRTPTGYVAVENLSVGDRVETRDHGKQKIRWIGSTTVSATAMTADANLRPVKITAGSFGPDMPMRDLFVSRQHRIMIDSWRAEVMFDSRRVLVPAHALVNETSVCTDYSGEGITYYHIVFDDHEVIDAQGLMTESFHPCRETVLGMKPQARAELFQLFPELENANLEGAAFEPAYPVLKPFEGRMFADSLAS